MSDQQVQDYSRFRQFTRLEKVPLPAQAFTQYDQTIPFRLFNTGFLHRIMLYVTGGISSGVGGGGSIPTYLPNPYNLIKKIRIYTSENVVLWDTSGWGATLRTMFKRRNNVPPVDTSTFLNSSNRTNLFTAVSGSIAASTTYPVNFYIPLQISTDDTMMLGLMLMQNLDVQLFMEVTMCSQSESGFSGTANVVGISVQPVVEFFALPPRESMALPNLRYVHVTQETIYPFTNNGDNYIRPIIGNIYQSITGIVENNNNVITTGNLNTLQVGYAQTVYPITESYQQHLAGLKDRFGFTPPDGSFCYDWFNGIGVPDIYEPRDFMNTSQQTDFLIRHNTKNLTINNAQVRIIAEQLAAVV